jgi:hypothetical protein
MERTFGVRLFAVLLQRYNKKSPHSLFEFDGMLVIILLFCEGLFVLYHREIML